MAEPTSRRDDAAQAEDDSTDERKERVLHTRVPDSLDKHLKRRARSTGMSVSTVVRNVLLTTFGLVEDIVNDGTDIALAVTGQETGGRRPRNRTGETSGEVVAWQDAVLNVNAVCDRCNAILPKGVRAAVGIREQPGPRAILCPSCLAGLAKPAKGARK